MSLRSTASIAAPTLQQRPSWCGQRLINHSMSLDGPRAPLNRRGRVIAHAYSEFGNSDALTLPIVADLLRGEKERLRARISRCDFCSIRTVRYLSRQHLHGVNALPSYLSVHKPSKFLHTEDHTFKSACWPALPGLLYAHLCP